MVTLEEALSASKDLFLELVEEQTLYASLHACGADLRWGLESQESNGISLYSIKDGQMQPFDVQTVKEQDDPSIVIDLDYKILNNPLLKGSYNDPKTGEEIRVVYAVSGPYQFA